MQDSSRPVTGYPVRNLNGCAPPLATTSGTGYAYAHALAVFLIIWLVLRPELPDFSVQSLSLSNFNATNLRVNATWNAQFRVSNPNKKLSISYGEVVSSVFHKDYFLSETKVRAVCAGHSQHGRGGGELFGGGFFCGGKGRG
ncbi:Detected protein of unknown function [Hibiscus syriacus]|uniref:Late embryogenesis abundant protein LEA-2 subgroup domain-containing protein n=1 Tax=Hibiscus syriacus TaxID=106335 RepID=A0A6A3CV52_HIBSY|nr:Detected protein of unknown function [Hibiscus syriacus]